MFTSLLTKHRPTDAVAFLLLFFGCHNILSLEYIYTTKNESPQQIFLSRAIAGSLTATDQN